MSISTRDADLPTAPLRAVTDAEIDRFWRDGVVVLRGVLPIAWVEVLRPAVERTITRGETVDLGPLADDAEPGAAGVRGRRRPLAP